MDQQRTPARDDFGMSKDLFSRKRKCECTQAATLLLQSDAATWRAVVRLSGSTPSDKTPATLWRGHKRKELSTERWMNSSNAATHGIKAVAYGERPCGILEQRKVCSSPRTGEAMAGSQEQGADHDPPDE